MLRWREDEGGIFVCPNEGCMASFSTYQQCLDHSTVDNCQLQLEKKTKIDTRRLYAEKLLASEGNTREIQMTAPSSASSSHSSLQLGWALKEGRKSKRFSEKQKEYLVNKFNVGVMSGQKEDPENVSEAMKYATNSDGTRLFSSDEFLTPQQIMSFFSRHARKNDAVREQMLTELHRSQS